MTDWVVDDFVDFAGVVEAGDGKRSNRRGGVFKTVESAVENKDDGGRERKGRAVISEEEIFPANSS